MMVRVSFSFVHRQDAVAKSLVLATIQDKFVLAARRQSGIDRQARLDIGVTDNGDIFRSRHEQPRDAY